MAAEAETRQRAAGAERGRSGGGVFASFAPWIVFWMLIGNVDFRTALLVACAIAVLHTLREARAVALAGAVLFTKRYPEHVRRAAG
ncbi:MAG: hypothetical protein AB1689_20265 [Thermodesulfobacteriota bacterium]